MSMRIVQGASSLSKRARELPLGARYTRPSISGYSAAW